MCLAVHARNEQSHVAVTVWPQQANIVQQAMPFQAVDSVQNMDLANFDGSCNPWDDDEAELFVDRPSHTSSSPSPVLETAVTKANGVEYTLINMYKDHCNRGIEQLPFSEEMKTRIELLHILKEGRVPHYLYQNIWKWAQSAVDWKVPFHDAGTRESLMYRYNLDDTLPITTAITLPGSGETVDITIHEFLPQLYSLLTDPTLMHDDNLLFWDDNPFGKPVPRRGGSYDITPSEGL
jgi:hypothetical protein